VAWSIADYLASLERDIEELLKEKEKREAKPEVKAENPKDPTPETKSP